MNKMGLLLAQLHDAETGLAAEYRAVAGRQAAEHDLFYLGHTLAAQCDQHAEAVRTIAGHFGKDLSGQSSQQPVHDMMAGIDPGGLSATRWARCSIRAVLMAMRIRGRPGWPPSRLALVTVLQRAEKLTGRLAAEAVRAWLDRKYLLGLPLEDPGFDHTVLAEFRGKVAEAGLEQAALDALLGRLVSAGLVKAGGKQRTDSAHVVAAVAALNRLELTGESVRAAAEALAAAHPDWLEQRICVSGWAGRYGAPMTAWRPPASQAKRDELAIACARDGYALLEAVYGKTAPAWLRELPAVDVLRRVLLQDCTRTITGGKEVIKRREKEPEGDGLPPGHTGSPPRMTSMPGGASSGTPSGSGTSCTSPRPAMTSRSAAAPAAGPGGAVMTRAARRRRSRT